MCEWPPFMKRKDIDTMGQVNSKSDASASHSSKTKVTNASLAYKWRKSRLGYYYY